MTEANCKKYMDEAIEEKEKLFWKTRIERKYGVQKEEVGMSQAEIKIEEVIKPKKENKK